MQRLTTWLVVLVLLASACAPVMVELEEPLPGNHTMTIMVWDSASNPELAQQFKATPGRDSRDLGAMARAAKKRGEFSLLPGCDEKFVVRVEFHDAPYGFVRGETITINDRPVVLKNFSHWRNHIDVPLCNGLGTLTLPASVCHKGTVLYFRSPWPGRLLYPPEDSPQGFLHTYGPTEAPDGVGECYKRFREGDPRSYYHFVK